MHPESKAAASRSRARAELFGRQFGMAATAQLHDLGFSHDAVRGMRRSELVFTVHPKVVSNTPGPWSLESRCMASALTAHGHSLVSGTHAAQLLGVSRWTPRGPVALLVDRRHQPVRGIDYRTTTRFQTHDRRDAGPIPCVSVERLVLELARQQTIGQLGYVMHQAAFHEIFDPELLAWMLARYRGVPGRANAVEALRAHRAGSIGTHSNLEDRVVAGLRARGVPPFVAGLPVDVGWRSPIHPDHVWADLMTYLETDGKPHGRARSKREDAARTKALRSRGWRGRRLHWQDLESAFDEVLDDAAAFVMSALA